MTSPQNPFFEMQDQTSLWTSLFGCPFRWIVLAALVMSCAFVARASEEGKGVSSPRRSAFSQHYEFLQANTSAEVEPPLVSAGLLVGQSMPAKVGSIQAGGFHPLDLEMTTRPPKSQFSSADIESVLPVVANPEKRFLDKCRNLQDLRGGSMTREQSSALLGYISVSTRKTASGVELELLSLKNDALICLIEQNPLHEQLGDTMIALIRNPEVHLVWREYVLQHLGIYYRARWPEITSTAYKAERNAIQETLAAALFHEDSPLAGTALIVVEDLSNDYPEFGKSILYRAARRVATSEDCSIASKLSAISIIGGEDKNEESLRIVADIVEDESEPFALRVTAIGKLSRMANSSVSAKERLQNIAWLSDRRSQNGKRLGDLAEMHLAGIDKKMKMTDVKVRPKEGYEFKN